MLSEEKLTLLAYEPQLHLSFSDLYGARATYTPGLRNLPCPSMPHATVSGPERPQGVADRLIGRHPFSSAVLWCRRGNYWELMLHALYSTTFYRGHEYGSYIRLLSQVVSDALVVAIHRVVKKSCGSSGANDSDDCWNLRGKDN